MGLCFAAYLVAFQYLLDQVDPAARAVQLITQQLVGGAGCRAKTAMNTRAQNSLRILDVRVVQEFFADIGLHASTLTRFY